MRTILTLSIAVLALAGCTATPAASTPHPTRTVPSSTPVAESKPALSDLVIGPDGLGPIRLGAPVPEQPASVAIARYDPDFCRADIEQGGQVFVPGAPFSGAWITTYTDPLAFTILPAQGERTGDVLAITVNELRDGSGSVIHTAAGIHPGSTTAELLKAYPKFTSVTHFDLTDIYTIVGSQGQLVFEVSPAVASDYWAAADLNRVVSIRAVRSASESPYEAGPTYGTDGGGPCPL